MAINTAVVASAVQETTVQDSWLHLKWNQSWLVFNNWTDFYLLKETRTVHVTSGQTILWNSDIEILRSDEEKDC